MKTIVQEKHWKIAASNPKLQAQLASKLGISTITAQLLINRGITNVQEAKIFLAKDIKSAFDPFLMKDMDKVTDRIIKAVKRKEKITVYGDYDADGLCSTALLLRFLKSLGTKQYSYYLPNRKDEGYGLNKDAIDKCREDGTQLLITVDCGISSRKEIAYANSFGIDCIVTDHHTPPNSLPECIGILNPKLPGCKYPYNDLAGVGVVYKLIQALAKKNNSADNLTEYLDLVALGTIADVVPITGENRIFTYHGLKQLENTKNTGIQKLKKSISLDGEIQTGHVAFKLAPRLNASGRLFSAEDSLKLLLTEDEAEAGELAKKLNKNNYERRQIENEVLESALQQVKRKFNFNTDKVIVIENRNWPVGVIGIVAGRLASRYHRPAIVISVENGIGKGSGRSTKNFHLLNALNVCKDFFLNFGGHAHAAGISIEEALIPAFIEKINEYAETVLLPESLDPELDIDTEVFFPGITYELIDQIDTLSPFGLNNPKPLLFSSNLELYREPQVVGKKHLKMWLKSRGKVFEAIGFGMGERINEFYEFHTIDLVYRPEINTWQNRQIIQLRIQDMRLN